MRLLLRHLLAVVIALVLPVQGYAAVAMVACAPTFGHHAAQPEGHAHHGGMAGAPGADDPEPTQPHGSKCVACASCCTASTAPSPANGVADIVAPPFGAIPFLARSEQSVVPDGLERPPRTVLG